MDHGKLRLVKDAKGPAVRKQRAHKPEEIGSRVFRKKGSPCYYVDLRWRGGGRPMLRDPDAPGAPNRGRATHQRAEAEAWAKAYDRRWQREQDEAEQRRTGRYRSLKTAREAFIKHRRAQKAPSTVSGDETALTHLMEFFEDEAKDPYMIRTHELQELCDDFLNSGYKRSSVVNTRNHLLAFFGYLKVEPNPASAVKVPKAPDPSVVAWYEDDRRRIRVAADELDKKDAELGGFHRRLVEFMLAVGTRIQETAGACWEDLDAASRTARVMTQIARKGNARVDTKGGKPRTTAVLPDWWPFHRQGAKGLIFPGPDGCPIPYRRLYDLVRAILERAGVKKSGEAAHQFRHTYAFLFMQAGGTLDELSKCLGHKRVSTTQRYYDHFRSDHAAKAAVARIYGPSIRRRPRGRKGS